MRLLAFAAVAASLVLSACQDPAGVGLGLIDEEQADPSVLPVPLADLDTLTASTAAIGIAASGNALQQARVLVGSVQDPVFGDARSIAYVDALQPGSAQDLEPAEVSQVWLQMPRRYAYGDTTTTLPVELRAIQGSWEADVSYPADTVFAVGPALTAVDVAVADTMARFDLPESWVRANAATLVGDTFVDDFEGFALQTAASFAPAPGAVFGLSTFGDGAGIQLVTTEADTLFFPLSEVFSSIATTAPTAPPVGILPVRRGSGADVRFTADLSGIPPTPLARGILRLPLDQSYAESGTFVRPVAALALLVGVRDGDTTERTELGVVALSAAGDFATADTRALTTVLQGVLTDPGDAGFDRYELLPPAAQLNPASLDILPLLLPTLGMERPPRFVLTLVGAPVASSQ